MEPIKKTCIYSFIYKPTIIPVENRLYVPVMAGNALNPNKAGMTGDDTGDSISEKNKYFSELTGIYWVWKNTKHEVTGCCHYRRYFSASEQEPADMKLKRALYYLLGLNRKRHGLIYTSNISRFSRMVLGENEITAILKSHDAILPQKRKLSYTVEEHYRRYHNAEDLDVLRDILNNSHAGYLPSFNKMLKGNILYANNMFVLPSAHFSRFMEWWFSLLFSFEKTVRLEKYQGYQQRVIGFIAERLLTAWFIHENLKVKELPVIYFKSIKHSS